MRKQNTEGQKMYPGTHTASARQQRSTNPCCVIPESGLQAKGRRFHNEYTYTWALTVGPHWPPALRQRTVHSQHRYRANVHQWEEWLDGRDSQLFLTFLQVLGNEMVLQLVISIFVLLSAISETSIFPFSLQTDLHLFFCCFQDGVCYLNMYSTSTLPSIQTILFCHVTPLLCFPTQHTKHLLVISMFFEILWDSSICLCKNNNIIFSWKFITSVFSSEGIFW